MDDRFKTALMGVWMYLKSERGEVTIPGQSDPKTDGDPPEDGKPNDPETPPADGDTFSRAYVEELRGEAQKKTQRAQKAEGENEGLKTEIEGLKKILDGVTTHLGITPETKPEDILSEAKTINEEAEAKIRLAALHTAFTIEANEAGMQKAMVPMAFKDSDFSDFVVKGMEVEGMADHVTALKAKYPALFNVKLEDAGEGATPIKDKGEPIKQEIEVLAQRQGLSVKDAQKLHDERAAKAKAAGKPDDFNTLWGIRRDFEGKII